MSGASKPLRNETAAHWALSPVRIPAPKSEAARRKEEQMAHAAHLQATEGTSTAALYLKRKGWSVLSALTFLAR